MGKPLEVGEIAPEFILVQDDGGTVSFRSFAGSNLVLYFYPKADTPGCTREAQAFTALEPEFTAAGARILGVSADDVEAQQAFKAKYGLTIPLGSDPSKDMLDAYGVMGEKTLYGRKSYGIIRTTYLIDRERKVVRVWRHVRVDGHAEAVLAAAKAIA